MELSARMRASDRDRDEAVLALGEHHANGRLTLPEFTARMERALRCTYLDELDPLFADLPAIRPTVVVPVVPAPARRAGPPVVMLALPLLVAFGIVAVGAGFFFPFWLPIVLLWVMRGPHRGWRPQPPTCAARQGLGHRGW
jgi:hypothetical protein